MCPVRKWEVKLFPKEKKKRKQVIHFGLNNWKHRKSKYSWLHGYELICRFAVVKQTPWYRLGRWAICLCKSLNYLIKSVGAQSSATYRIFDVSLHMGQNPNKVARLYLFCVRERERKKKWKGRKEGKTERRKWAQKVAFPEIQSQISKSHNRMLGICFTLRADSFQGTGR